MKRPTSKTYIREWDSRYNGSFKGYECFKCNSLIPAGHDVCVFELTEYKKDNINKITHTFICENCNNENTKN